MPENNDHEFGKLNDLIQQLGKETSPRKSLDIGILLANEIMHILGVPSNELCQGDEALKKAFSDAQFKNQKIETWFEPHPQFSGARIALDHYDKDTFPVESKFYQLNKSATKTRISVITQLVDNWEDSELTRRPGYKVGIDFFLNSKADSFLMVITDKRKLRVLELSDKLSNTQKSIFSKIKGCFLYDGIDPSNGTEIPYEPQRTIHKTLWDALALNEVNKNFYSGISEHFELLCQHLNKNIPAVLGESDIKESAKVFTSRLLGRLLFVWFLRKKGIINKKFEYFSANKFSATDYYEEKLKRLFFEVFNTPKDDRKVDDKETPYLNGGLFDPHKNDWNDQVIPFPDGWFVSLYEHLDSFNFTTDESSPEYEQIAIDPEMLGRVFENLLASMAPETSKSARNNKGAFYTPRDIVSFMCKESFKQYIKTYINNEKDNSGVDRLIDMSDSEFLMSKSTGLSELWGNRSIIVESKIIESINKIKILDPACGSGAFPIGLMQLIVKTLERLTAVYDKENKLFRRSKPNEKNDIYYTKLFIIQNMLYGSDIEPMAVEISKLRTWLSLIVDSSDEIVPLPNLNFNFICANSLIPLKKQGILFDVPYEEELDKLKEEYFNAHSFNTKNLLKKKFEEIYSLRQNTGLSVDNNRSDQLSTWDPFHCDKPSSFFDKETMFNIGAFDIVIGNPPYIHLEDIKKESKEIYKPLKNGQDGYVSYKARGDIYTLFYEMGVKNLRKQGTLCYITSNKWMRASYGESLREYLAHNTRPKLLIDLGPKVFDSATVDTNILLLTNEIGGNEKTKALVLSPEKRYLNMSDLVKQNAVEIKFKSSKPWVILSPIEQSVKDKIERNGIPLKQWPDIKINYGIKTGYNEAFIIKESQRKSILMNCSTTEEREKTDKLIRPILRGKDIKRYTYNWAGLYVIMAYFNSHKWLEKECPELYKHLFAYKDKLNSRGQCSYLSNGKVRNPLDIDYPGYIGMHHWLELDNCPSKKYMDDFDKPKIIYPDICSDWGFSFDDKNYFLRNTAYFITSNDTVLLRSIFCLFNSKLIHWYYDSISAQLGENSRRMFSEYIQELPISEVAINRLKMLDITPTKEWLEKNSDIINEIVNDSYQIYNMEFEKLSL